jgi:hypothetical protein
MPEKIPKPESLPSETSSPELMSELEVKINTIRDDIRRIDEGTKIALKNLKDKEDKERQDSNN